MLIHVNFFAIIHSEYSGAGITQHIYNLTGCTTVKKELRGKIQSLKVFEECAKFYKGDDCTDTFIEVLATDPFQGNLGKWKFRNMISSVAPCEPECSMNVIGPNVRDADTHVFLFPENNCVGVSKYEKVRGCVMIPEEMVRPNMSLHRSGECIVLYNTSDCKRFPGNSVELRRGSPHTCELSSYKVTEFRFRSLSLCSFQCIPEVEEPIENVGMQITETTTVSEKYLPSLPGDSTIEHTTVYESITFTTNNITINGTSVTSEKTPDFENEAEEVVNRMPLPNTNHSESKTVGPPLYFPLFTTILFITVGLLVFIVFITFRVHPATRIP